MLTSRLWKLALLLALLLLTVPAVLAQEGEDGEMDAEAMEEAFIAEFNQDLLEEHGYPALARNPILDDLAQQISDAVGCSDDEITFDIQRDIIELGYEAYPGDTTARTTRLPLLPIVNLEDVEFIVDNYSADVFGTNLAPQGRRYREIGVGITPCVAVEGQSVGSNQQYALFVILGAQPDVIPVVVGDGTGTIETELEEGPIPVTVSVHSEESRPRPGIYGATESVRLSSTPIDDSTEAIAYEGPFISWELECGENTVFYELTDGEGLTSAGEIAVEVACGVEAE